MITPFIILRHRNFIMIYVNASHAVVPMPLLIILAVFPFRNLGLTAGRLFLNNGKCNTPYKFSF